LPSSGDAHLLAGSSILASAVDAARAGAASNEFLYQWQKERLAEPAERRLRLEIERLADRVLVVLDA
jgi:hypothetical protein